MRRTYDEQELKIEWLYSNLRWFFLLAVGVVTTASALSSDTEFPPAVISLLVAGGIANMLVTLLLILRSFHISMAPFTLLLDITLTLGLIVTSGGADSPLLFMSLIPIITTSLRYNWLVSLGMALLTVLIYWWGAWIETGLQSDASFQMIIGDAAPYLLNGLILLLAGGGVSYIGTRIRQQLNEERQRQELAAHTAIEAAHQKVRLIFELASTLSATLNYERVLDAALDVTQAGLEEFVGANVRQVQIIMLFGLDHKLYVETSRGLTMQDKRLRLPGHEGGLAEVLETAGTVLINDPGSDPELGQFVVIHQCRQAVIVPLRAGFENYGVMVMANPESGDYPEDFRDLLEAVCNQAVMALQNARLYQNLMDEKERLVVVEENARKKLARDLHDGPTQTIAAIAMRLNYARILLTKSPQQTAEELLHLEDLARRTTKEIRQMLFTLRPLILETQGLAAALEHYVEKMAEIEDLAMHLELEAGIDNRLSKEAQGALFYIIEEAITNARKHANASDLWIRVFRKGLSVIAEVEDNGKGFDVAAVESNYTERSSLGLLNLYERATLVNGKTVIQSAPGKGTKVIISVPTRE